MSNRKRLHKALTDYRKAAQETAERIRNAEQIYQPDAAKGEIERLQAALAAERQKAQNVIQEELTSAEQAAAEWARLDGSEITDDAKLLEYDLITPEQFSALAEKYRDNGTMTQLLRNYADGYNARLRDAGKDPFPPGTIDTAQLPTIESRQAELAHDAKSAAAIIGMIDGGFLGGPDSAMVDAAISGFSAEG